jgi:penicillin-binding protein 2
MFAPAEEPRIAVAVVLEQGAWGASSAGPIARKILDAWLTTQPDAPPDTPLPAEGKPGSGLPPSVPAPAASAEPEDMPEDVPAEASTPETPP